jgi:hypothetical protein
MTDTTPLPPDSADAAADGVRLAELVEALPLSRASVFEVVKALGITTAKGPGPDGRGRVAWLSSADADRVGTAAHAVHRGEVRIADLSRPSRQTRQTTALRAPAAVSAGSADAPDPAPFLARLEAAERAVRSGLALSTAETGWILGCRPGGTEVVRGGIRAVHLARDQWRLVSADSGDALRNVSGESPDSGDTM